MDKKLFAEQLGILGVIFEKKITASFAELYYDDLKALSNTQMIDAVKKWRQTGEWFPKPSQLLDMVVTPAQSAGEAWALVLKELRDSKNANLPAEVMSAVNEIGGIDALAHMTYSQLEFKSKDFKAAYTPDRIGEMKERLDHDPQFKALGKFDERNRDL